MSVANPEQANAALEALGADRGAQLAEFDELHATRTELERGPDPTPDGGSAVPAGESEAADGGDTGDVADEPGFAMTDDRRVGSMGIDVDGHGSVRFGKPSGRASTQLLAPLQRMDDEGGDVEELAEYVWHTLANWSLDEERDADHWASEHALVDAIGATRSLALGGNARQR